MLLKQYVDIWRDVFDFVPPKDRRELALKFAHLGDCEFSDFCQKWLHEWTKRVCLGPICIMPPPASRWIRKRRRLEKAYMGSASLQWFDESEWRWAQEVVPFPDVEMPANICSFKAIECRYLDPAVLQFLRRLLPILRDVNLDVKCGAETSVQVEEESSVVARDAIDHLLSLSIGHLMPLLTRGINSVQLLNSSQLLFSIRDQHPAQFYAVKQFEVENVQIDGKLFPLLLRWLGTGREDGESRMLVLKNCQGNALELVKRVRKLFVHAKSRAGFCILIRGQNMPQDMPLDAVQQVIAKNANTNEHLMVRKWMPHTLIIIRYPVGQDLRAWILSFQAYKQRALSRKIIIDQPTIGLFEEATTREEEQRDAEGMVIGIGEIVAEQEKVAEEYEEDDDDDYEPGASKKRKSV